MKILTKFTADVIEADFREGAGHHHHVGQSHQVKTTDGRKGAVFSRHMRVGPEGILFQAGDAAVCIRTEELWRLVEKAEPRLAVPAEVKVPAEAGKSDPKP